MSSAKQEDTDDCSDLAHHEGDSQQIDPYNVTTADGKKIDYDKLIVQFGCQRIDENLISVSAAGLCVFVMRICLEN